VKSRKVQAEISDKQMDWNAYANFNPFNPIITFNNKLHKYVLQKGDNDSDKQYGWHASEKCGNKYKCTIGPRRCPLAYLLYYVIMVSPACA